jgi:hypothetical protein
MMIIWWSKHIGVILSVLMCDSWINVLLHTSALVGPLHIVNWNARWNSEIRNPTSLEIVYSVYFNPVYIYLINQLMNIYHRVVYYINSPTCIGSRAPSSGQLIYHHQTDWIWLKQALKAIGETLLKPCYLSRDDYNRKIMTRKQRTDVGKYSFVYRTIKSWTQLPAGLLPSFPCKLNTFRKTVKNVPYIWSN